MHVSLPQGAQHKPLSISLVVTAFSADIRAMNLSSMSIGTLDVKTCLPSTGIAQLTGHAMTLKCIKGKNPKLVYEWEVREPFSASIAKARVEVPVSMISEVSFEEISAQRNTLVVNLTSPPEVLLGEQTFNTQLRQRNRAEWFNQGEAMLGSACMPAELREALEHERCHKLHLKHTLQKIQGELHKVRGEGLLGLPAEPPTKRPLSEYNKMQKMLKEVNAKIKIQCKEERGSNGTQCDGCGATEDTEDFTICRRCLYTCCDICACDHCHGSCFCERYAKSSKRQCRR